MIKKLYYSVIFFNLLLVSNICKAAPLSPDSFNSMKSQVEGESAFRIKSGFTLGSSSVGSIVATIIQAFLGLLGIIFVILVIISGYNWMTSAGNEEKVTKAKETLTRAIIGLIIIISAYAITYFVFKYLPWGGSGTTTNPIGSSGL